MADSTKRYTWLGLGLCLYFNLSVVVAEVEPELQEGTVIALACLFGFLFIVLVLSLTCFLVRRHRKKQFLKRKKEFEILQDLNKEFSDSLHSEEIFPSTTASATEMVLLQNGRVPVHGEKVQYTDWARRQPQPSPLLYAKRVQDIQPSGKQYTQRVFTMPAKSQTVFTQQPKMIIRQNRAKSAPPPLMRTNYYSRDGYGFTNRHFLPVRNYMPTTTYVERPTTHITKRYVSNPMWRQEVIRTQAPAPAPMRVVQRSAPLVVNAPEQRVIHHRTSGSGENTYHVKLDTNTMNYSNEKIGDSSYNVRESSYRERTYTEPSADYVVNTKFSSYKPKVLQGTYYGDSDQGWRVVGDGETGISDTYRFSGSWAGQELEEKTQTAIFDDNDNENDVFVRQEPQEASASQTTQRQTYEEVVIVDYVEPADTKKDTPLSSSTPRFPGQEVASLDDVLNNESSGTSSGSESDSGLSENRRQRNPSSGSG